MILYGGLLNQYVVYDIANAVQFSLYGAVRPRLTPTVEQSTTWPIYGGLKTIRQAPVKVTIYGAMFTRMTAPVKHVLYGALLNTAAKSCNISGLSISNIAEIKRFPTPDYKYNIYPYLVSDVAKVIGLTDYLIIGSEIICTSLPAGAITVIPFNRLQLKAEEVKQLQVINLIPDRAEYQNITVSGSLEFSLDQVTWTNSLVVEDVFYVRAPAMAVDGTDYSKDIELTATVYPRG